jgi:Flp pilus assembly protein TadD/V8-like Glu-specific endopeptidase
MKKSVIATAIVIFLCAPVFCTDAGLKNTINKCKKAVVKVIGFDENDKEESQGTGFFISSSGLVVTNCHVIEDSASAGIRLADEKGGDENSGDIKTYMIKKIISSDEDADMVIFSVEGLNAAPDYLSVRGDKIETGDNVYIIGHPMGLEQTVSNGIVSGIKKIKEFGFMYQTTAPISPGSSGSPVMDANGEVIGVATSTYKEGQNLNFVMPSEKLRPLMRLNANMKFAEWKEKGYSVMPSSDYGRLNLGQRFYDKKKYKEAAAMAASIIKGNPKYSNAYSLMAFSLFEQDRREDALKYMRYGVSIDPAKEFIHNDCGVLYADLDMDDLAANEYYSEIKNFPKNYLPYCNLASLYYRNEMTEDAFRILDLGIKKSDSPSELYVKAGDIGMDDADYSLALQKYKQAVKLNSGNADALLGLGRVLLENDDKQGATDCYYALQKISTKKAERLYFLIEH